MRVYLIRHGESQSNVGNFFGSWLPVELTEKGRQQALATGKILADVAFDAAYCSDLLRARQTAALALPHLEFTYTDVLREIKVGSLLGKVKEDCAREYGPLFREHCVRSDYTAYGGEDVPALMARVQGFLDSLVQSQPGENVAVVCHAGVIRSVLRCVLGNSFPTPQVKVDNGSVSTVLYENGRWVLERWNCTGIW